MCSQNQCAIAFSAEACLRSSSSPSQDAPSWVCKLGCLKFLDASQCMNLLVRLPSPGGGVFRSTVKIDTMERSQVRCSLTSDLGLQPLKSVSVIGNRGGFTFTFMERRYVGEGEGEAVPFAFKM